MADLSTVVSVLIIFALAAFGAICARAGYALALRDVQRGVDRLAAAARRSAKAQG